MQHYKAFIVAIEFLTTIPVIKVVGNGNSNRLSFDGNQWSQLQSLSVLYYPLVGLLLAFLLSVFVLLLSSDIPVFLKSALFLLVWVGLTGALHLDGLADAVDAAFASHKSLNSNAVLAVFKDPNVGVMAVVALILILLLKFSLIVALIGSYIIFAPMLMASLVLSRLLAVIYMLLTPYAKPEGLAVGVNLYVYRFYVVLMALFFLVVSLCFFGVECTLWLLIVLSLFLFLWRFFWIKKISGYTGDCVGAVIEISEVLVLLVCLMNSL